MAKYLVSLLLSLAWFYPSANDFKSKVDSAVALISTDLQKSRELSGLWLQEASEEENIFGIIKLNFVLGYISKKQGNYGQGAIHYLEALRWSEQGDYEGLESDKIAFHKNLANIYKRFGHFDLAEDHYDLAMEMAFQSNSFNEYSSIIYNLSIMLQRQGKYEEAIEQLTSTFSQFDKTSNNLIAKIYNQVGLLQSSLNHLPDAIATFNKLVDFVKDKEDLDKEHLIFALHNIGNVYLKQGHLEKATNQFQLALTISTPIDYKSHIFLSSKDLGDTYYQLGDFQKAKENLELAESLYHFGKEYNAHYEIYKILGNLYKDQGDYAKSSQYQELYSSQLEAFLAEQQNIEQNDKKYNLDLITQRYFAMVAEQERNAQLTYYSTVGASCLMSVIILILGYFQYRKYRLRKTLEESLRPFTESI